ncbi:hypothetical protein FSP39_004108 [Pinctada imbricata]|uniref:Transmembrane protein 220 n=1 Tax=Pinctada imbricata TaxID=66713 RepID=A0AA89BNJ0_PINIB|nr:hypothetical protein FSP39_004108 [Pinctada imbricata]
MEKSEVRMPDSGICDKLESCGSWRIWRAMNAVMFTFFLLAGYVNLNDPDWYLWIPIYGVCALLCLPLIVKPEWSYSKIWNTVAVIHLTFCLSYAVYQVVLLMEAVSGRLENPLQHEEGREAGGLLIIITWLIIGRFTQIGRPVKMSNKYMMNALLLMAVTLTFIPLLTWSLCFVGDWHKRLGHCKGMF